MLDIISPCGLTHLPSHVRLLFKGMPGVWRHRHQLIFCWLVVMHMVLSGPRTLTKLALSAPRHITGWRFRRLLSATYWNLKMVLCWFAEETIKVLPPPKNNVIYLISDGSKKGKLLCREAWWSPGRERRGPFPKKIGQWLFGILPALPAAPY